MTGRLSVLVRDASVFTKPPVVPGWVCRWVNTDLNRRTKEFVYRPAASASKGRDDGMAKFTVEQRDGELVVKRDGKEWHAVTWGDNANGESTFEVLSYPDGTMSSEVQEYRYQDGLQRYGNGMEL